MQTYTFYITDENFDKEIKNDYVGELVRNIKDIDYFDIADFNDLCVIGGILLSILRRKKYISKKIIEEIKEDYSFISEVFNFKETINQEIDKLMEIALNTIINLLKYANVPFNINQNANEIFIELLHPDLKP